MREDSVTREDSVMNKYMNRNKISQSLAGLLTSALLLALVLVLGVSCSSQTGWGVVLWSIKGTDAKAGSIVPVYVKSNITKTYVIGLNDDRSVKMEVPLWQIEVFRTKKAAEKRVSEMGEWKSIYLIAQRDGLPIRQKPANGERRVYRLRQYEMVKVLAKVQGEAVYTGNVALPGEWYQVLTMDGTKGYVFSNTMKLFDESTGEEPSMPTDTSGQDTVSTILTTTWRPSWYTAMLNSNAVDLDYFSMQYGLFGDLTKNQIRVELPGYSQVFNYTSVTQDQDWFVFSPTPLRIRQDGTDAIIANWDPTDIPAKGEAVEWHQGGGSARFVAMDQDLLPIIQSEQIRRENALRSFFSSARVAAGQGDASKNSAIQLSSDVGGELTLWPSGLYSWQVAENTQAGFAPGNADPDQAQKGKIVFGVGLSDDLSATWQGAFSLYPDSSEGRSDYVYAIKMGHLLVAKSATQPGSGAIDTIDSRFDTVDFALSLGK